MDDAGKTREELIEELRAARLRIEALTRATAESQRDQNLLEESRALYNSLMEHSLDGIYIHLDRRAGWPTDAAPGSRHTG